MEKLKKKIISIGGPESNNYPKYMWERPLNKVFEKSIWFDLSKIYIDEGKEGTGRLLLALIKKELPDYILFFDSMFFNLEIIELIEKIKEISPKTQTIFYSGDDDDNRFNSSRYLALFFDYVFIIQNDFLSLYKKDGLKNVKFVIQLDISNRKNSKEKKIYDVSFMGSPKADREEILEWLYNKKVNISIFGPENWKKNSKFKEFYRGHIPAEDFSKKVDQTKINLCLSKNGIGIPHLNTRFFENTICKAFSLVEYSPQFAQIFKEDKEIIFFRKKEELLKKINYYLKQEKKREKIVENAYKKIISKFDLEKVIRNFVKRSSKSNPRKLLPKINYSIINIDEKKINLPPQKLLKKIKGYDYISFSKGNVLTSPFKEYLQIYSLLKNKKEISCCDYYLNSRRLGDYGVFIYAWGGRTSKEEYKPFLDINQLVVSKNFFIKNFELIKKAYLTEKISFVNDKNTAFISIPLIRINSFRKDFFKNKELYKNRFFLFYFHKELYSKRKKPLKLIIYFMSLILEGLAGKKFIFGQLFKKYKEKGILITPS